MREIDQDIWIKYILKNNTNNVIIDDARYYNELKALKDNGFIIIKLDLDKDTQLKRLKKCYPHTYHNHINNMNHESECSMDENDNSLFDVVIKSDNQALENIIDFLQTILLKNLNKNGSDSDSGNDSGNNSDSSQFFC